ncbi:MAG: aminopeptidase P family protein [Microbacterium gubbeenense]|uniref:aminopeptidase P family protein n=1 Tax=Microbacterium gubbeenense TaxID=159896 RepID=UPI003F996BDD
MSDTTDTTAADDTNTNRRQPFPQGFLDTIGTGWAERADEIPDPREAAPYAAARRQALSARFPSQRLVIPAGGFAQRSNDTDFPFRAHSAFAHLTGWGADAVPDSLLVFEPDGDAHAATLFLRDRATRDMPEFYRDASIGEFWVGPRPSLDAVAHDLGIATKDLGEFAATDRDLVVGRHDELTSAVSELRLEKDDFEVRQLQLAVDVTAKGFDDIVRELPRIIAHERGERIVEGVFHLRARSDGNWEGYDTIAASGPHACYLHWTRNDGAVVPGDLMLVDAGVELDSLYTADITRTIPVSGTFTPIQRTVYEAVREAADAAFAAARPGMKFRDLHDTAMRVIAARTAEWGLLPVTAEEALDADKGGQQRRYMVHGTSHHLGLDVHDCAQARREMYYDGVVTPGMVFTIEPGLYFQIDDETVPAEYRGIGVRIEDDILMTADGPVNLSAALPRTADEIEAWVSGAQSSRG